MAQPAKATLAAEDLAAIRATGDRFAQAMIDRDFEALTQLYTVDAVLMPPNQPLIQGREQIRTFMEGFPKVTRFSIDVDEIDGQDDLAYVRGTYSMTLDPEGAPIWIATSWTALATTTAPSMPGRGASATAPIRAPGTRPTATPPPAVTR